MNLKLIKQVRNVTIIIFSRYLQDQFEIRLCVYSYFTFYQSIIQHITAQISYPTIFTDIIFIEYKLITFFSVSIAKPDHLGPFFHAWEDYLLKLKLQRDNFGSNLNENMKSNLTDDQKLQLINLREEALKKADAAAGK